jgi:hypothetical protein
MLVTFKPVVVTKYRSFIKNITEKPNFPILRKPDIQFLRKTSKIKSMH